MVATQGIPLPSLSNEDLNQILGVSVLSCSQKFRFKSMAWDSRQSAGDLFVAINGISFDGHQLIKDKIAAGAQGIVAEIEPPQDLPKNISWWHVQDSRKELAHLSHEAYGSPASKLQVYGVTGTNGKSSTVRWLASILQSAGLKTGWMTTVDRCVASEISQSSCTTAPATELAEALNRHHKSGGQAMVLEVSSHAIHQSRVAGISWEAAGVTQLGRDHLDYHKTVDAYHRVKLGLQSSCKTDGAFLVPVEGESDSYESAFEDRLGNNRWTAQVEERNLKVTHAVLSGPGVSLKVALPRPGKHDLSNALCAAAMAYSSGISKEAIQKGLETGELVEGRMEQISPGIFVDYAHTPDALQAVLTTCRDLCTGSLRVVFGCGGDRDRGKRPEMGRVADEAADVIYLTDDNPRSENPSAIIEDIVSGVRDRDSIRISSDRRSAIETALSDYRQGDILVIAGKGHEKTQEVDGVFSPFSDSEVILECLGQDGLA